MRRGGGGALSMLKGGGGAFGEKKKGGTLKPARRIFCKREEGSGEGGLKSSPKRRRTCSPGAAKMNPLASGCMSQKRFSVHFPPNLENVHSSCLSSITASFL